MFGLGAQARAPSCISVSNFKSYDELKIRLSIVLAGTTTVGSAVTFMEDEPVATVTFVDTKEEPAPTISVTADNPSITVTAGNAQADEDVKKFFPSSDDDEDEDTMDYFQKLANDD